MSNKTSRDDSVLNTGITSASSRFVAESRKEAIKKRKEDKVKLSPAYDIVAPIVKKHLANARDIETVPIDVNLTNETFKTIHIARKMNIAFIKSFGIEIRNALKELE